MKKVLLLSAVASTVMMAGGDIAPISEPVVAEPVVETSKWTFSGQAVAYYQTRDSGTVDLFEAASAQGAAGLQLSAVNKDVFSGVGAGVEVSGISDLWLYDGVVEGLIQSAGNHVTADSDGDAYVNGAAAITQAYLTYGVNNTTFKVGRQTLPKGLSPFAFSEGWNVFKNSFEAALVVNSDIPATTLVGAYVTRANGHGIVLNVPAAITAGSFAVGDNANGLNSFNEMNADNGVFMLTAQNKSLENTTLTGTFYYAPEMVGGDDVSILWADAKTKVAGIAVAVQGGTVTGDGLPAETTGFGAKVGGSFSGVNTSVSYSQVDDGTVAIANLGTGANGKSPLYTQMVLNNIGQLHASDSTAIVVRGSTAVAGGKLGVAYGSFTDESAAGIDASELDVTYKTKLAEDITAFAAYVYTDSDTANTDRNFFRVWTRYNF